MSQTWRVTGDSSDGVTPRYPITVTVSVPTTSDQSEARFTERRLDNHSPVEFKTKPNTAADGTIYKTELVLNRTPQKFVIDRPVVSCQRCKRDINLQQGSEIQFHNRSYHPDCFKCTRCHRNLSDTPKTNFAVHSDGEPLCLQCETELAKVCDACHRPIVGEKSVAFDGNIFHTDCFRCGQCRKVLLNEKDLHKHDSKPCCDDCYKKDFAPRCAECSGPIGAGKVIVYDTKKYHPECFRCGQCHKPMVEREFFARDSKPCCISCYNARFAERCAECSKLITDGKSTIYNNKTYHPDCMRCGVCRKVMGDEKKCYNHDSKPCCNQCYTDRVAPRCAKCSKPVLERSTVFKDKNYHTDCFTCAKCNRIIGSSERFYDDKLGFLCTQCGA